MEYSNKYDRYTYINNHFELQLSKCINKIRNCETGFKKRANYKLYTEPHFNYRDTQIKWTEKIHHADINQKETVLILISDRADL